MVSTSSHARRYDISIWRAAAEMDPVSSIARNKSALPGPMAIALRNRMRICGLRSCLDGFRGEESLATWLSSGPAPRSRIIGGAGFNPACALRRGFFFSERGARLQVVHQEFARLESFTPVRACHPDPHDLVRGPQRANTMHNQNVIDIPARACLRDDLLERFFGHARIVFERHLAHAGTFVHVPDDPDETRYRADLGIATAHGRHFGAGVKILSLYAYRHFSLRLPAEKTRPRHPGEPAYPVPPFPDSRRREPVCPLQVRAATVLHGCAAIPSDLQLTARGRVTQAARARGQTLPANGQSTAPLRCRSGHRLVSCLNYGLLASAMQPCIIPPVPDTSAGNLLFRCGLQG